MVHLYRDPKGETALDVTSTGGACTTLSYRPTNTVVPISEVTNNTDKVADQTTELEAEVI